MEIDDATGLPSNTCDECGIETLGYLDDPDEEFICEECIKRCGMCDAVLNEEYGDDIASRSCYRCK